MLFVHIYNNDNNYLFSTPFKAILIAIKDVARCELITPSQISIENMLSILFKVNKHYPYDYPTPTQYNKLMIMLFSYQNMFNSFHYAITFS